MQGIPMGVASRSPFTAVFRFVLVGLLTSLLMISTTVLIAICIAGLWSGDWGDRSIMVVASVCALIVWLFIIVFHLRHETLVMPFTQREQFIAKTKTVLHEMGYVLAGQQADELTFRPRFNAYLLGGCIIVTLDLQVAKL